MIGKPLTTNRYADVVVATMSAMTVAGACFRFLFLGHKSFWWDEVATVEICSALLREFWQWIWRREANMTFYYLLVRQWIGFFGHGEVALRSLSVIFAVVSIPVIYLVGMRAFQKRRAGLLAALLLSVNTAHIAYSQEARSYALLVLLCLLSLLFFLRLQESGTGNAIAYVLVSVLAVYTHFFAVFFLGAQWCSLLWLRHNDVRWKQVLMSIAAILLLVSPALYYMLFRQSGQLKHTPSIRFNDLFRLIQFLAAGGGRFHRALSLLYVACIAFAIRSLIRTSRAGAKSSHTWSTVVLLCCLFIPVVATFMLSFWMPMFAMHYLLICLPPFVLLAAEGLAELPSKAVQAAVGGCIVLLSIGALGWYYAHPKDDWRGMAAYVIQHYELGDAVIGCPAGVEWPFQHYASKSTASRLSYRTPADLQAEVASHRSSAQLLTTNRLWVVTWGATCDLSIFSAMTPEYERVERTPFGGGVALALYAKNPK
jgi:mannosyltransferase